MDSKSLSSQEEKTLREERAGLRTMISLLHNMLVGNNFTGIDLVVVKSSFERLSALDTQLMSHLLANGTDTEPELSKCKAYADKVSEILTKHPAAVAKSKTGTSAKFLESKLPEITAKDPASWLKFRTLLELAPGAQVASDDEKLAKLIAALPPKLAVDIRGHTYAKAIEKLEEDFESEESLRTIIRDLFLTVPKIKSLDDQSGMKKVHEAIDSVFTLATKVDIEKETMALAYRKLPKALAFGFLKEKKSKKLSDLGAYLKEQAKLIDWNNELMGLESSADTESNKNASTASTNKPTAKKQFRKSFTKPTTASKVNSIAGLAESDEPESDSEVLVYRKVNNKKLSNYVVSALYSDASESEDENDEIIIDAEIEGKQVKMLYDPGAKKNLLPAKQFKSPDMDMRARFRSATGHIIKSSGPKSFRMDVKGASIPIKAYVNNHDLSILGRQFTKKCSVSTDGHNTKEIVYHNNGAKTVVYKREDPMHAILQVALRW